MATEKRLIDAKALERQIKEAFKDSNPVLMGQMLRWGRKQTKMEVRRVSTTAQTAVQRWMVIDDGRYKTNHEQRTDYTVLGNLPRCFIYTGCI